MKTPSPIEIEGTNGALPIRCFTGQSLLPDLLRRHTAMPVRLAEEGMPVVPNTVYVIPPGPDLIATVFALMKIGAIPVLVDPGAEPRRPVDRVLQHRRDDSASRGGIPGTRLHRTGSRRWASSSR